jgi:hypothetical protein
VNTDGFGDLDNKEAPAMAVLGSNLYAGTSNQTTGCEVWRYDGGTTWTRVGDQGLGDASNDDVRSIRSWQSGLYVGTLNSTGCEVRRYDGGTSWTQVNADGFGDTNNTDASSMGVMGANLFAGTQNQATGGEVWRYGGSAWTQANADGFDDVDNFDVPSMCLYDACLYAGTANYATGCEVWRTTPTPTVTSITPNAGTRGTTVSITNLAGTGFWGTPTVKLKRTGSTDITATNVAVVSSAKITCRFALPANAAVGAWNLFVANPDSQSATRNGAFSVTETPVDTHPDWYLAEGTTSWGFGCYISIQNPNETQVHATVTYNTSDGPVSGGTLTLPAASQTTVNPASTLGSKDFSTFVHCTEGKTIAVDRTMEWTGPGAASPEGHNSVGVNAPDTTWYLPEGSASWGFECWLLIQNPNASAANCTVTYMIEGSGPQVVSHTVDPNSRATFNMETDIGSRDASIKVTSDQPVIPERAMYRNDRREGHDSIGTTTPALDYFLAEGATGYGPGFITYVLVQNPQNSTTSVDITFMTGTGQVAGPSFAMDANSRKTVRVNDYLPPDSDVSTRVHGSAPIIAERAMYWNGGTGEACHDSVGMDAAHAAFYLPDGQTSDGRETWTLVQNPNASDVTVEISYLTPSGTGNVVRTETIGASSRRTFNMEEHSGISGRAAIMVTSKTSGKDIMVERAMYWNSRGAGTDTIGGYSN